MTILKGETVRVRLSKNDMDGLRALSKKFSLDVSKMVRFCIQCLLNNEQCLVRERLKRKT